MPRIYTDMNLSLFQLILYVTWILNFVINTKGTLCPCDYNSYQGSCYRVLGSADSDKKTWRGARLDCQQRGGDLASVTDQQEQDFIWNMQGSSQDMWIGLFFVNGGWKWTDGSQYSWKNWYDGSNLTSPQSGEVHARVMTQSNKVQWQGQPADGTTHGYVCKQKHFYGGDTVCSSVRCYTFVESGEGRPWSMARHYCQSINQQLLSVPAGTILGVRDDAESVINNRMCTTSSRIYWTDGQPSSSECPSILIKADGLRWTQSNTDCTALHHFICSRVLRCPSGWRENAGMCYHIRDTFVPQQQAQQTCKQLHPSANLLSLNQPAETQFMYLIALHRAYWISLTRPDPDSPWTWVDGTPYNYINWAPGYPKAQHTCAYLKRYKRYTETCTHAGRLACKGRLADMANVPTPRPALGPVPTGVPTVVPTPVPAPVPNPVPTPDSGKGAAHGPVPTPVIVPAPAPTPVPDPASDASQTTPGLSLAATAAISILTTLLVVGIITVLAIVLIKRMKDKQKDKLSATFTNVIHLQGDPAISEKPEDPASCKVDTGNIGHAEENHYEPVVAGSPT